MAKRTRTNKAVTESSNRETSMEVMKKKQMSYQMKKMRKKKWKKRNTDKNMEDDSNVNKIKKEVQNIDGLLAGSGNCRS